MFTPHRLRTALSPVSPRTYSQQGREQDVGKKNGVPDGSLSTGLLIRRSQVRILPGVPQIQNSFVAPD
jgi:hypothetical protein